MTEDARFVPAMEGVVWTQMAISGFAGVTACREVSGHVEAELSSGSTVYIPKAPQGEDYMFSGVPPERRERIFTLKEGRLTIEPPASPLTILGQDHMPNLFEDIIASAIWSIRNPIEETDARGVTRKY